MPCGSAGILYLASTTASAVSNPASTSPYLISPCLNTFGRPDTTSGGGSCGIEVGLVLQASSGSTVAGNSSYFTLIAFTASSAASSVSAATSATSSPQVLTLSLHMKGSSPNIANPSTSGELPVRISTTPGIFSASLVSTLTILA